MSLYQSLTNQLRIGKHSVYNDRSEYNGRDNRDHSQYSYIRDDAMTTE
jgi:hypothetical protein